MSAGFIVTGTDTGIGKTVFSAALAGALHGYYWKPIQSGLDGETDSDAVRRLSGLSPDRILPEAYRLKLPASPHISAAREGTEIDPERMPLPWGARPIIIEGAGGLLVPLSGCRLQVEQFLAWDLPVILCASTALGTINHTLLSLEALKTRRAHLLGIAFVGDPAEEAEHAIASFSGTPRLGRLPFVAPLDAAPLAAAFRSNFDLAAFA